MSQNMVRIYLKNNGTIIFCELCEVKVNNERKFVVTQHINFDNHKLATIRKNEKKTNSKVQQLVTNGPIKCLLSQKILKIYIMFFVL